MPFGSLPVQIRGPGVGIEGGGGSMAGRGRWGSWLGGVVGWVASVGVLVVWLVRGTGGWSRAHSPAMAWRACSPSATTRVRRFSTLARLILAMSLR